MKLLSLLFCPFLLIPASGADPAKKQIPSLTLKYATATALSENRSIRETRSEWEAAKARVAQAAAWDDVKISVNTRLGRFVDIAPNGFTDQMVSVEQMIPVTGKNLCRARIAAAEALQSLERLRRQEIDVVVRVRKAYISLASHNALLALYETTETSLAQSLDTNRAGFQVGEKTQNDILTAELELLRLDKSKRDLLQNISEEETQLKVLMNQDPFTVLGRPSDKLPEHASFSVEHLRELLLNNRPEIRAAKAMVSATNSKVELARRDWIPDPTISVQAQRYNEGSQVVSELSGGISFSVPWLNGKKYRAEGKENRDLAAAAKYALEEAETDSLGLLHDQLLKIETLHHHVELFRNRLLPKAQQITSSTLSGFPNNTNALLDVASARRTELEFQSLYRQDLADYQMALAELEAIIGTDLRFFPANQDARKATRNE